MVEQIGFEVLWGFTIPIILYIIIRIFIRKTPEGDFINIYEQYRIDTLNRLETKYEKVSKLDLFMASVNNDFKKQVVDKYPQAYSRSDIDEYYRRRKGYLETHCWRCSKPMDKGVYCSGCGSVLTPTEEHIKEIMGYYEDVEHS